MAVELTRKKPTYAELESEIKASREVVRDYSNRVMELAKIQADYEQRLDFFHTAVSLLSKSYIGTWDLPFALEKIVKFGFAESYEAGEKLAEIYSEFNGDSSPADWSGYIVEMVYDRAMDLIYETFPSADSCISFTQCSGCYTEFYHIDDDDSEDGEGCLREFKDEVVKFKTEKPDEFAKIKGILQQIFEDIGDEEFLKNSLDFEPEKA